MAAFGTSKLVDSVPWEAMTATLADLAESSNEPASGAWTWTVSAWPVSWFGEIGWTSHHWVGSPSICR